MNEETLFHLAQEKPPAERDAFLDEVCPDAALRRAVESLLDAHDNPGSFMGRPAVDLSLLSGAETLDNANANAIPGSAERDEVPGTCIGHYKLLEQIGQGGMGTVFMADQTHPVKRKVAVKIIRKGMDSRQVIARFEAERQALALMDHPNIARVFDAGTTDSGRPYFVMELVRGVPITRYCDERRLSPRQRMGLFVAVCHAVHHAHQKGIIHRDIKPSNVLVAEFDGKPVPKVIDFGVAKAAGPQLTTETLVTELGSIVGTVQYMSPEQAGLNQQDVDTRSDIYSLGVLLYELLTGTTPLEPKRVKTAALLEVLRLVREEEAPRPSTRLGTTAGLPSIAASRGLEPRKLSGLVRGELDWIVMRALEKDRSRRYESANGLASDIGRYLNDEPVLACPPSAGYRLRKFVRRHKGPVSAASLLALLLVGGIAGTASQAIRANAQARRAGAEAARANEQAKHATLEAARANREAVAAIEERNAKQAALEQQTVVREQAMETLNVVMDDLFHRQRLNLATLTEADRTFCRTLANEFREFAAVKGDSPANRDMRAMGHFFMGSLRSMAGEYEQACFSYEKAVPLLDALAADFPSVSRYRDSAAVGHENYGILLRHMAKPAEAQTEFLKAIASLSELIVKSPANPLYRDQKGRCHNYLGMLLEDAGELAESIENDRTAIALFNQLVVDFPDVSSYAVELGGVYCNMGHLFLKTGKLSEALDQYQLAIRLLAPLAQRESLSLVADLYLSNSHAGRATTLEILGRFREAIEDWNRAVELSHGSNRTGFGIQRARCLVQVEPAKGVAAAKELMQGDPDNLEESLRYADIMLLAGDTGDYKELCARQLEHSQTLTCAGQPGRRNYLLARLCLLAPDAIADSTVPIRLAETALLTRPKSSLYLHTIALAHYRAGQYDESIKRIDEAMLINPTWPGQPANWLVLAMAHSHLGHIDLARHWFEQATVTMDNDSKRARQVFTGAGMHPHDWLACQILRREAVTLIPHPSPSTRPAVNSETDPEQTPASVRIPSS